MIKKYILAFACFSFLNFNLAAMEKNELASSAYPITQPKQYTFECPLSCNAIVLSEIVQLFRTDKLKTEEIATLSCRYNQLLSNNTLIIHLLLIITSEIFKKENTLTLDLVKPIFNSAVALEALLDLANAQQKENLICGKLLIRFLLELENESEDAKIRLSQTRQLFIALGILKPETDTHEALSSQCSLS